MSEEARFFNWNSVTEDTAYGPPFGTIRKCQSCCCLVAGGPTSCVRCGSAGAPASPTPTKPTNPKDAVGIAKVPFSTLPTQVIAELGLAMLEGARKYGRHNYRVTGVRASVYFDAAMRHLTAYWEGEDTDPASDLPHLVKAMACLAVLRDSQVTGKHTDDRPPRLTSGWQELLNQRAAELLAKYPDAPPAATERGEP